MVAPKVYIENNKFDDYKNILLFFVKKELSLIIDFNNMYKKLKRNYISIYIIYYITIS